MRGVDADSPPSGTLAAIIIRHLLWEDALALLMGIAMVVLGIASGLLAGGTVGLAC